MGYIKHHAIVVTGFRGKDVEAAHRAAENAGCVVTPFTDAQTNGYRSFLVAPDGSKEGWDTSLDGDSARERFKEYLAGAEERGQYLEWVEVAYGSDDADAKITDHAWMYEEEVED